MGMCVRVQCCAVEIEWREQATKHSFECTSNLKESNRVYQTNMPLRMDETHGHYDIA